MGKAEAGKGEPVRPTTTATKQPKAPDTDGLGTDGKPAGDVGVRESGKPAPVKTEAKAEPKKAEPVKAESKVEPKNRSQGRT